MALAQIYGKLMAEALRRAEADAGMSLLARIDAIDVVGSLVPSAADDKTPPVTTSNVATSYPGAASITLSATDNTGGSGVAATYYQFDSGTVTLGTRTPAMSLPSLSTCGTSTLFDTIVYLGSAPCQSGAQIDPSVSGVLRDDNILEAKRN